MKIDITEWNSLSRKITRKNYKRLAKKGHKLPETSIRKQRKYKTEEINDVENDQEMATLKKPATIDPSTGKEIEDSEDQDEKNPQSTRCYAVVAKKIPAVLVDGWWPPWVGRPCRNDGKTGRFFRKTHKTKQGFKIFSESTKDYNSLRKKLKEMDRQLRRHNWV